MKKAIRTLVALSLVINILSSCSVGKNAISGQQEGIIRNSNTGSGCYVQIKDGSTRDFTSIKMVTGVFKTPYLLADGKEIIEPADIIAYKNEELYAVSPLLLTSKKKSFVAVKTLPGFAVKIVSGKINVYHRKFYNGSNTVDEYFIQDGDDGFIVSYTKDLLKGLLKEDAKAMAFLNSNSKVTPKSSKIVMAIELYNNGQLITKN